MKGDDPMSGAERGPDTDTPSCGRECVNQVRSPLVCVECCSASWPAVLGSSLFGLFRSTLDGKLLCASEGLAGILGYASAAELLAAVTDMARDVYFDPAERAGHVRETLAASGPVSREMLWKKKDGTPVWVRSDKILVRDEEGHVLHQEGVIMDIDARRRAEDALRASEARYRALFEASVEAVFVLDDAGSVIDANATAHLLTARNGREIKGRKFTDLFSPTACIRINEVIDRMRGGGRARFRCDMARPGGDVVRLDIGLTPVDETSGQIQAVCHDITALTRAQTQLREALDELSTIFENSQVGVMLVGDGPRIRRANARLAAIFGYAPEEMEGMDVSRLHLDEERFRGFRAMLAESVATGGQHQGVHELCRKDGTPVWCQVWGKALDPADISRGVIWVIDDVTERKRDEELRQDVERMARHDLKGPLGAIISYPVIIAEEGPLTPGQAEDLERIREAGFRMLEMINLSLDLYKMEQGSYDFRPERVDVLAVLDRVLWEARAQAMSRDVGLSVRIAGKDGDARPPESGERFEVRGETLLAASMLSNLVKNAVEASPRGGEVTVMLAATAAGAVISIRNAGEVPAEVLPRFMQKYATANRKGGTGLGAYSARLMAEVMGGHVDFESSPEHGTAIFVTLPLAEDAEDAPPAQRI